MKMDENTFRACFYLLDYDATQDEKFKLIDKLLLDDSADIYTLEGKAVMLSNNPNIREIKERVAVNMIENTQPVRETTRVEAGADLKANAFELLSSNMLDDYVGATATLLLLAGIETDGTIFNPDVIIDDDFFKKLTRQGKHVFLATGYEMLNELYIQVKNNKVYNTTFLQKLFEIKDCKSINQIKNKIDANTFYYASKLYKQYTTSKNIN